jgi:hypothetical protein
MSKKNNIIYWVATIWLSLGMVSTGIVQIIQLEEEALKMKALGYPMYFFDHHRRLENTGCRSHSGSQIPTRKGMGLCRFLFCHDRSCFHAFSCG